MSYGHTIELRIAQMVSSNFFRPIQLMAQKAAVAMSRGLRMCQCQARNFQKSLQRLAQRLSSSGAHIRMSTLASPTAASEPENLCRQTQDKTEMTSATSLFAEVLFHDAGNAICGC